MKKNIFAALIIAAGSFGTINYVSAHAVVSPKQANVGEFINFSLGVPSERTFATISVRLLIPSGLNYVTPYVKPGWKIQTKKNGGQVVEIDWTGSSIPAEQKDQFLFSAQVPTSAQTLQWKVYQTYQDGTILSWDQDPSIAQQKDSAGKEDYSKVGPCSKTVIINDLAGSIDANSSTVSSSAKVNEKALKRANLALILGVLAIIGAIGTVRNNNK